MDYLKGGETVLVRGKLAMDGRSVTFGAGLELKSASLDIVTDVPAIVNENGEVNALLMFFANEWELIEFANEFRDDPRTETRMIAE